MNLNIYPCLVFVILNKALAKNDNFNFTYSMASRCKEHISRRGYNYDTFYHIDEDALQHATVKRENTDVTYFEMHIAIQAASNGHILLSPIPRPGRDDPVYEIVVGGGGNKFTELRLNLKRNARSSVKTPNILSTIDFTAFYIKISNEGLLEFGKEGDSLPMISYYDAHTLPIKYFSFASWAGVEAKFLYDCPASADDVSTPDSQVVEPKLSNSEELKRTLLMSKLPSIPPSPTMQVQLNVRATHVKYNAADSKLSVKLAVVMGWTDDSMAWSPTKFNGTTSLKFRQGQIWRPMFFVYNSDNSDPFDTLNPDLITVVYSGDATFHFQTEVTIWCSDPDEALREQRFRQGIPPPGSSDYESGRKPWPRDKYTCSLVIEPWEVHEKIALDSIHSTDNKLQVFADIDEMIESEWDVTPNAIVIKPSLWNRAYKIDDNETHRSDRYFLTLDLERRATTYNIVFYTPLLVLLVFVLISFCSEPLQMSRVWFYAGCSTVICLGLSNIDYLVPTHTVPYILVLYITVLGGVLLAMMVQVLLMTSTADRVSKTVFVQGLLSFSLLRIVFCLPPIKISLSEGYSRQEDLEEEGIPGGSVEEDQDQNTCGSKKELAEVIDKFMFFVYSATAAIMLAEHY